MTGSWKGKHRVTALAASLALGAWLALAPSLAAAAPVYLYRGLVLPSGDAAADLGVGIGRAPVGASRDRSVTGVGLNLALAGGLAPHVELGVRTGLRFEGEGRRMQADQYGRTWDTETYGIGSDSVANPELHLRWAVIRGAAAQLGLEFRLYVPIERGTHVGFLFGVPLMFRVGNVRVDTGLYVPMLFSPQRSAISIPLDIWFQVGRAWLGPLLGVRAAQSGGAFNQYPFGFGLGYAASSAVDFRTWVLFPDIGADAAARTFGVGFAVQVRFE